MANKSVQSDTPSTWPAVAALPRGWSEDDDVIQEARWQNLAKRQTVFGPAGQQATVGPFTPNGTVVYRLMQLRCGDCRKIIGVVEAVDAQWHGSAFTWAALQRVDDPDARPPTVKVNHVVLDNYTAGHALRAQCVRDGLRTVTVKSVTPQLGWAVDRIAKTNKSLTITMGAAT
jgi:hypothetical protein